MPQKPLVICAYGWGRTLKLYQEYLDVDGTLYALNNLMHMRAIYRRVMNISSLRLELQFHERLIQLRGIHVDHASYTDHTGNGDTAAEHLVAHLKRYCPTATISSLPAVQHARKGRETVQSLTEKEQTSMTSMSDMPTLEHASMSHTPVTHAAPGTPETPRWLLELAQDMQRIQSRKMRRARSLSGTQNIHEKVVNNQNSQNAIAEIHNAGEVQAKQRLYATGNDENLHTLHAIEDEERERFAQHLQADTLPSLTIPIPLRLAAGEQARYNIEATLCAEPLSDGSNMPTYTYPVKDQGTLILTNRRLIYMGRRGQRVLGYARIIRISRMRGAIVILTDMSAPGHEQGASAFSGMSQRIQREVFQVSRPLECALYLDHLLRQFYAQIATRHLPSSGSVPVTNTREDGGDRSVTEGIDARSIQHSLNTMKSMKTDIADIETCPLTAISM